MTVYDHDELAHNLAVHLSKGNRRAWENIPAGPGGSIRPDVYTIEKSFAKPNPMTYEIKVSRSDFLSDIKSGKWQRYLDFSYGVTFAVPKGLVTRKEVPESCGLIQFNGEFWTTSKRPTIVPRELDTAMMLKLIIDGNEKATVADYPIKTEAFDLHQAREAASRKFGKQLAKDIARLHKLPEERKRMDDEKARLGALFNVSVDKWCFFDDVEYHINELKEKMRDGENALKEKCDREMKALKKRLNSELDAISRRL